MSERIPTQRWLDGEIAKMGMDPEQVHRIADCETKRAQEFMRKLIASVGTNGEPNHIEVVGDLAGAFLDARDEEAKTTNDLAREVIAMLDLQQAYFKRRSSDALAASKLKEREIRERCRKLLRRVPMGPSE